MLRWITIPRCQDTNQQKEHAKIVILTHPDVGHGPDQHGADQHEGRESNQRGGQSEALDHHTRAKERE